MKCYGPGNCQCKEEALEGSDMCEKHMSNGLYCCVLRCTAPLKEEHRLCAEHNAAYVRALNYGLVKDFIEWLKIRHATDARLSRADKGEIKT